MVSSAPDLVQGDPGERLLFLLRLMAFATSASAAVDIMSLTTEAATSVLFTEIVSSEPYSHDYDVLNSPDAASTAPLPQQKCWRLTTSQTLEVGKAQPITHLLVTLDQFLTLPHFLTAML